MIIGVGVRAVFVATIQLLSRRRIAITTRTAKTFGPNVNDHWPTKDRHMAQAQQPSITMELADFRSALPADRPFSCAFHRDDDLSPTQFGIEDADLGQIQGNFNLCRYRFYPLLWFRAMEECHSSTQVKRPQNVGGSHASS